MTTESELAVVLAFMVLIAIAVGSSRPSSSSNTCPSLRSGRASDAAS